MHVLNEDFLEAHTPHHFLIDTNGLVVLWGLLVLSMLEHLLSEEIVFDALVMVIH